MQHDGIYEISITIEAKQPQVEYNAPVHIEMLGPYGYISATDFPFLPVIKKALILYVNILQYLPIFLVLRHNVYSLCYLWYYLVSSVIYAMA